MGLPPGPAPALPQALMSSPFDGGAPPLPTMADYSSDSSDATEPGPPRSPSSPLAQPQFLSPPVTAPPIRRSLGALTEVSHESRSQTGDWDESRRPSRPIHLDNVSETSEQETAILAAVRAARGQVQVKEYGKTQHGGLVRGVSEPPEEERRQSVFDVFGLANTTNEVGGCLRLLGAPSLSHLVIFCHILSHLGTPCHTLSCLS